MGWPASPAARAGLRRGDLIEEVQGQPVQSVREVREAIAKADDRDALPLLVQRGQGHVFVALAR
jgi:serine protease Do